MNFSIHAAAVYPMLGNPPFWAAKSRRKKRKSEGQTENRWMPLACAWRFRLSPFLVGCKEQFPANLEDAQGSRKTGRKSGGRKIAARVLGRPMPMSNNGHWGQIMSPPPLPRALFSVSKKAEKIHQKGRAGGRAGAFQSPKNWQTLGQSLSPFRAGDVA